jgi:hypothetical protein
MLIKCTLESFIFGVVYGLYFLKCTRKGKLYFAGRWEYVSNQAILFHFLSIVSMCGFILIVFNMAMPRLVSITFLQYLSHTIGMVLVGFSLVYFLPKI